MLDSSKAGRGGGGGWGGRGQGNNGPCLPASSHFPLPSRHLPPKFSLLFLSRGTSFMACAQSPFRLDHSLLSLFSLLNSYSFIIQPHLVNSSRKSSRLCPPPILLTCLQTWALRMFSVNIC